MHQNNTNYSSNARFELLELSGGPLGVKKVILLRHDFFLVESMWSFWQNTLYLSRVSGLGGHGPWF